MLQATELTDRRNQTEAGGRRIAVLVPCYNEEAAIARVVADFRANLPDAELRPVRGSPPGGIQSQRAWLMPGPASMQV